MEKFVVGDVVAIAFPYADAPGEKLRPALVLAVSDRRDLILCQITSKARLGLLSRPIEIGDFTEGNLPVRSFVRLNKLFTADRSIIRKKRGRLDENLMRSFLRVVRHMFDEP